MARAGGPSTATGVSFQALAIARWIIDVHQGNADFVRAEASLRANLGGGELLTVVVDDFVVRQGSQLIYFQVKSNAPGGGLWTANKLDRQGILRQFRDQLDADPNGQCRLVTPNPCPLLGDVASRAATSMSLEEFLQDLTTQHRSLFDEARSLLRLDPEECFHLLQRCRLEVRADDQLRQELRALAEAMFADPAGAVDSLFALAATAMTAGIRIDRAAVARHFSERLVFGKPALSVPELAEAVTASSSRLRSVGKEITWDAGGTSGCIHIIQPTVSKLFDWANQAKFENGPIAVLLDQAGSGKTVAMSVLQNRLEAAGHTVLAIKVDGLSFRTLDELTAAIHLPAPILATVQKLKTAGHRVAVLIDQVDALSSAMSRDPAAIGVMLDLVSRLTAGPRDATGLGVPVVLACRSFDWKYDHRFEQLRARDPSQFTLPEFSDEQLRDVLSAGSIALNDLHPLTAKIIRSPLRLSIFMKVVAQRRAEDGRWSPSGRTIYTLQGLYQEYWDLKMRKAGGDGVNAADCESVVSTLATRMHNDEHLAAPEGAVSDMHRSVDWLVSEGILDRHQKNLTFFHQTFFDFVFARGFVASGRSLADHLLSTDQGLFHRPMTRQVLEYLRDSQRRRYLTELQGLLTNAGIRAHIRWMVVAWVGQQRVPLPEERELLEPLLLDDSSRPRVLGCLRENPGWFDLLGVERFRRWLASPDDSVVGNVIWFLHWLLKDRPSEICSLISPYVGQSQEWNARIASCLGYFQKGWTEDAADLLIRLLADPHTEISQSRKDMPYWGMALEHLAGELPQKGCEAIKVILTRCVPNLAQLSSQATDSQVLYSRHDHPLLPGAHGFEQAVDKVCESVPGGFMRAVLPWTLLAMEASCRSDGERFFKDNWSYWDLEGLHRDSPTKDIIRGIDRAACRLASSDPGTLRELMPLITDNDFQPMQVIAANAYRANPAAFAADAARFLAQDPRRLWLGVHSNALWFTSQLIAACSPFWQAEEAQRVEQAVLDLDEGKARSIEDLKCRGLRRLELLLAFDRQHLSDRGINMLGQWQRKFPGFAPRAPQPIRMHFVGSPITEACLKRMDDRGWLRAMRRFIEDGEHGSRPHELSGGRIELSRSLKDLVKAQPGRFYRLAIDKLGLDFHPDYLEVIVHGLAEAKIPVEQLDAVIRKFLPVLESGSLRMVASAIEKYAEDGVPDGLIQLLKRWAVTANDPAPASRGESTESDDASTDRLLNKGLNSDRGHAVWTLAHILLKARPPRPDEYIEIASRVAADPCAEVRAVAIQFLQYAIHADARRAVEVFCRLVGSERRLLRERGAYDCIYRFLHRHVEQVLWAIEDMISDNSDDTKRDAGAKLACLAAFESPVAHAMRDRCLAGDSILRQGAATIYATNVAEPTVGAECRARLEHLFSDPAPEVRKTAASFLAQLQEPDVLSLSPFIRLWAASPAFEEGVEEVSHLLEKDPTADPALTLDIAAQIINVVGRQIVNPQVRYGMVSYHLVPAILNVYHRALDKTMRVRAIDLFEDLEALGDSHVSQAMESADRI